MKTLILGGVKSGKSRLAESLAESQASNTDRPVVVIATAIAKDDEMHTRIAHHKQSRPSHWQVIEEPVSLADALIQPMQDGACVIVDCLTLWMTNLLLAGDDSVLTIQRQAFIEQLSITTSGTLIIVSNETSMGIIPMGDLTRRFCDEAGMLHQQVAEQCDNVVLTIAGLPMVLKGFIDK